MSGGNLQIEESCVKIILTGEQCTIKRPVEFSGIGLHKGQTVRMVFKPAPLDYGIVFKRVDLPEKPEIKAVPSSIVSTQRSTNLGKEGAIIYTVEHIMAAIRGAGIDNLLIELDAEEPPIGDGSALPFARLLMETGLKKQEKKRRVFKVTRPLYFGEGEARIILLPSSEGFRASFMLKYDHPHVGTSYVSHHFGPDGGKDFITEIAPARTFGFAEEVEALKARGLALGGSLENAVVFGDEGPLNTLRFEDEPARHKLLDLFGDLGLLGYLEAEAIGIKSGHGLNAMLTRHIWQELYPDKD